MIALRNSRFPRKWLGALLLPLAVTAGGTEPAPGVSAAAPVESSPGEPATTAAAEAFDLHGENLRRIIRATASTQASSGYRIEAREPPSTQARLAEAVRQDLPAVKKQAPNPRLPDRPPPCDSFFSCAIDTLLGIDDFDDALYNRVERDRLMKQGSFTNSNPNAAIALPMSPAEMREAGAPVRPAQP
jgi:hypothetical protein